MNILSETNEPVKKRKNSVVVLKDHYLWVWTFCERKARSPLLGCTSVQILMSLRATSEDENVRFVARIINNLQTFFETN